VGYHVAQSAQNFPRATITTEQGATSVTNGYYDQKVTSTSADVGLRTRFNTGAIKHTLIAGANMLDQQTDFFYKLPQTSVTSNLYNPAPLGRHQLCARHRNPAKSGAPDQLRIDRYGADI